MWNAPVKELQVDGAPSEPFRGLLSEDYFRLTVSDSGRFRFQLQSDKVFSSLEGRLYGATSTGPMAPSDQTGTIRAKGDPIRPSEGSHRPIKGPLSPTQVHKTRTVSGQHGSIYSQHRILPGKRRIPLRQNGAFIDRKRVLSGR